MAAISDNMQAVSQRIARAAAAAGRNSDSVRLLAVSKTHPVERIEEAFRAGQTAFGENYVQEALEKMDALTRLVGGASATDVEWHLIGPLQSNKTRLVAERFNWVHTVSSAKVARRLSEQRAPGQAPLNVLIQVNSSAEPSKSGVNLEEAPVLAHAVAQMPHLRLRGLMAIPEPSHDAAVQRARFRPVQSLYQRLRADGLELDTLSLGMSEDLEAAIAEGSTMVRVGTAIFGARRRQRDAA
ncbi:MAG TPA: YggS family pyridoxal phosphate-dependent enzyme [Burkholderiales bacterium]|nr:YggS family pyridoxal phosphate-dependent enzyme [Burkholderiales bacterium]